MKNKKKQLTENREIMDHMPLSYHIIKMLERMNKKEELKNIKNEIRKSNTNSR